MRKEEVLNKFINSKPVLHQTLELKLSWLSIYLLSWFHIHSKLVSLWVNCIKHIQQQQQQLFNTGYHPCWQPWLLLSYTNWRSCISEFLSFWEKTDLISAVVENIHTLHTEWIGIPWVGGLSKTKTFKEMYAAYNNYYWNFQGGGGRKKNLVPRGGMDIFWTTERNYAKPLCCKLTFLLSCQALHCSEISCNYLVILWVPFCPPQW